MKHTNALLMTALLLLAGNALAEDVLNSAGKQLLKNAATAALPKEAVTAVETLETANKLKDSVKNAPDALKAPVQAIATEAAKQELLNAVPEKTKQDLKAVVNDKQTLKKLKAKLPKSTRGLDKTVKEKAKLEAAKQAVKLLQ